MEIKYFVIKHLSFHLVDSLSVALIQHCAWLLCAFTEADKATDMLEDRECPQHCLLFCRRPPGFRIQCLNLMKDESGTWTLVTEEEKHMNSFKAEGQMMQSNE